MKASLNFPHRQPSVQRNKRADADPPAHIDVLDDERKDLFRRLHGNRPRMLGADVCYWCGDPYSADVPALRRTREHVLPKFHGGGNDEANIVGAHSACNQARGFKLDWVPFYRHGEQGMVVTLGYDRLSAIPAQEVE